MMYRYLVFPIVLLSGVAFLLSGCNQGGLEGLVSVEGVVMHNDQPVEGAFVSFTPKTATATSSAAAAYTDVSGRFKLMTLHPDDGAYPGDYRVAITKIKTEGDVSDMGSSSGKASSTKDNRTSTNMLPVIYGDAHTSGLDMTIPPEGKKDIRFDLTGVVDSRPQAMGATKK